MNTAHIARRPRGEARSSNNELVEALVRTVPADLAPLLADDVEWVEWVGGVPSEGARTWGKAAFIQNYGGDRIESRITRMVEEHNVVVVEGIAHVHKADGPGPTLQFVNIYEFEDGTVKRKTSYGALIKNPA